MTTIATFPNFSAYNLAELTLIAGDYREIKYNITTGSSTTTDFIYQPCLWTLSPLGDPNTVVLTKDCIEFVGGFSLVLFSDETIDLHGVYEQRAYITGGRGYGYYIAVGRVNILAAIGG